MALTITENLPATTIGGLGNRSFKVVTLAFDASYPTGGESLTPAIVEMNSFDFVYAEPTSGYIFEFDYANNLLLAYYLDYNAGADSAAIQVPDTTNLATLTGVRTFIIGG